jgi:hypothetical protein
MFTSVKTAAATISVHPASPYVMPSTSAAAT